MPFWYNAHAHVGVFATDLDAPGVANSPAIVGFILRLAKAVSPVLALGVAVVTARRQRVRGVEDGAARRDAFPRPAIPSPGMAREGRMRPGLILFLSGRVGGPAAIPIGGQREGPPGSKRIGRGVPYLYLAQRLVNVIWTIYLSW
jgi:hypothetical protein